MLRTKVLHKHKKVCFTLLKMMEQDHDIKPGTLFRAKQKIYLMQCKGEVDKDQVVISVPERGYLTHAPVAPGAILMFIDIVYDPFVRAHFLRFLYENTILGFRHEKGKTLPGLKHEFDKIDSINVEE